MFTINHLQTIYSDLNLNFKRIHYFFHILAVHSALTFKVISHLKFKALFY